MIEHPCEFFVEESQYQNYNKIALTLSSSSKFYTGIEYCLRSDCLPWQPHISLVSEGIVLRILRIFHIISYFIKMKRGRVVVVVDAVVISFVAIIS